MLRPIPEAKVRRPDPEVAQGLLDDRGLITEMTFRATSPLGALGFPIVFFSTAHLFPDRRASDTENAANQAEAEAARLLYVGMTRARDQLYLTYISA